MASCLGPNQGRDGLLQLIRALGLIMISSVVTAIIIVRVLMPRFLFSEGIDPSDVDFVTYSIIVIIVFPFSCGFFAFYSGLQKESRSSLLPTALASLSTAALVYIAPVIFLCLFVFVGGFMGYLLG